MHLLVLSAFRPGTPSTTSSTRYTVSMHLLVLSAFRLDTDCFGFLRKHLSQCTFWCSVLSDLALGGRRRGLLRLNAPFGAQCFPTRHHAARRPSRPSQCTFWCSVLSDALKSRLITLSWLGFCLNAPFGAQCFPTPYDLTEAAVRFYVSMHLLVLSAFRLGTGHVTVEPFLSQCTFWCSVLSDRRRRVVPSCAEVSMHLLVLSAFRHGLSWQGWR